MISKHVIIIDFFLNKKKLSLTGFELGSNRMLSSEGAGGRIFNVGLAQKYEINQSRSSKLILLIIVKFL